MPTYFPISNTVPQYTNNGAPYSGAVLKAYADTTSTPISMATDYTGNILVSTITLNAAGYPTVSGNIVIPHIAENYKLALYPDAAAAASNTGAIWSVDNMQISSAVSSGALTDIASAATINLNSTTTNYFNITGGVPITGITLAEGVEVTAKFAGALTITHGPFLINIGGANIITAAGDIAVFRGEAGGVVRMIDYVDASASAFSGEVLISTVTVSTAVSSVDFVHGVNGVIFDGTYRSYRLEITEMFPASSGADFQLRVSTNLGSTYMSGSGNYMYGFNRVESASASMTDLVSISDTKIPITSLGSDTVASGVAGVYAEIVFPNPSSTSHHLVHVRSGNAGVTYSTIRSHFGTAVAVPTASAINAFRVLANTGNIAAGTFKLYGRV